VRQELNLALMNQAAVKIIGRHDFVTFGSPPRGTNTFREVFKAEWQDLDGLIFFDIEANAYLYRMVRSLVGTMKLVGQGLRTVEDFEKAKESQNRKNAGQTAPANGLFLMSVTY
jgi:tRNA pseudouridine38-40 synthase